MAGLVQTYSLTQFVAQAAKGEFTPRLGTPQQPAALPVATGRIIAQLLVSDVRKRFSTGTAPDGTPWRPLKYPRPNGGSRPLQDTGELAASITGRADKNGITVGTVAPGAALMNNGGTVRPIRGKFLTIPNTREAKRAGSPRRMRGTRDVPLFAHKVRGAWVGHWILAKVVDVPARPFMGVSRVAQEQIERVLFDDAVRQWSI